MADTLKITLHSITEDKDGRKYINYSTHNPDGSRVVGSRIPLGGTIQVSVQHKAIMGASRVEETEPTDD